MNLWLVQIKYFSKFFNATAIFIKIIILLPFSFVVSFVFVS